MDTHTIETDFCVIGGGLSGVCAALAAARNGSRVVLVQDRSVLGGNSSSEVKMHIVGADCHGYRPGARETGLMEELRLEDAVRNPQRSFSMWDLLLYEKVKLEPNITLLLDSLFDGCETATVDGELQITAAHVIRNITEDRFIIRAKYFSDCSGDGRLGAEAGADFTMGRESRDEYGEPFAQPVRDNHTLGCSIMFTARKYDTPQPFIRPSWVRQFEKKEFKYRPIHSYEYGFWWSEWGGQLDTIKDNETIRHEVLRIALGVWDYIKNSGDHPGAANYALDWVGIVPGKRESRRFLGDYVLRQQDVEEGRIFEDQVAYGGWWLDLHPPEGVDAPDEKPCVQHPVAHLFSIPLRCLYSRNVRNLFFAGRNISATHVAFASTRVMATCAVMGQAVGTAAARCLKATKDRGDVSIRSHLDAKAVRQIQQNLLRDDAFLLGLRNEDHLDLARAATVTASSGGDTASNVINGITRRTKSEWGSWAQDVPNSWQADSVPAWLQLELPEESAISEIHLTFDSGLDRELMLTPSDFITKRTTRGAQPELIKDYDLCIDDQLVLSVKENFQRKNVHRLEKPVTGKRVKIQVHATHGHPKAQIFEVRLYENRS